MRYFKLYGILCVALLQKPVIPVKVPGRYLYDPKGGEILYEEICYVCVALAIAIQNAFSVAIAIAIPKEITHLGGRHGLSERRRDPAG